MREVSSDAMFDSLISGNGGGKGVVKTDAAGVSSEEDAPPAPQKKQGKYVSCKNVDFPSTQVGLKPSFVSHVFISFCDLYSVQSCSFQCLLYFDFNTSLFYVLDLSRKMLLF